MDNNILEIILWAVLCAAVQDYDPELTGETK
jgi:hypothetical protein